MKWDDSLPDDWDDAPDAPPLQATGVDPTLLGVGLRRLRVSTDDAI